MTGEPDEAALVTRPFPFFEVDQPDQYTYAELARSFGVELQTVYEWVKLGRIPSPHYKGRRAFFKVADLVPVVAGPAEPGTYTPAPSLQAKRSAEGKKLAAKRRKDAERKRRERAAKKAAKGGAA